MFTTETLDGITVVTTDEELDARNAQEAKEFFRGVVAGGQSRMVVDLESLNFIDSSGLGALLTALKTCRAEGGDVRLCRLSEPVRAIFELTCLFRVFDAFDDRDTAVASFTE